MTNENEILPEEENAVVAATAQEPNLDNFDWEAYEKDEIYSKNDRETYLEKYNETLSSVAENEVVDGTIIAMVIPLQNFQLISGYWQEQKM